MSHKPGQLLVCLSPLLHPHAAVPDVSLASQWERSCSGQAVTQADCLLLLGVEGTWLFWCCRNIIGGLKDEAESGPEFLA